MKPTDRWQDVKEILYPVLEMEAAERASFLDEKCGDDAELRDEVESLIAAHDNAAERFESPAVEMIAGVVSDEQSDAMVGRSIGHYDIIDKLGSGGMGEVYLAHDSRLNRKVALKVLPVFFTQDPDRLRRFQQEARAASALNHPNILTVHDIGNVDSINYIATEFVDGETLRDRMNRTPLKISEALDIATQVTSALATAHEAGIIHRDIKPENIMLRHDGIVKVLDFGLAKLTERPATDPEASTMVKTDEGIVMGTAQYMAPEQARGLKVDVRSDIWSLGAVLYEMLAGRAPFTGPTSGDVIVSILEREPAPLTRFADDVPAELEWLVKKALRKKREERYQSVTDLLIDLKDLKYHLESQEKLDWSGESGSRGGTVTASMSGRETARPTWSIEYLLARSKRHKRSVAVALASLVIVLAASTYLAFWIWQRSQPASPQPSQSTTRFTIVPPPGTSGHSPRERDIALSPDGRYLAYLASPNANVGGQLMLRPIDRLDAHPIVGITRARMPFFSPDGRWIGFIEGFALKKVSINGGPPITICENPATPAYANWGDDGNIVYGTHDSSGELFRVSAGGGEPEVLTTPNVTAGERAHQAPLQLPGGRGVLFTNVGAVMNTSQVAVLDFKTGRLKTLIQGGSFAEYIPLPEDSGRTGYLVYAASGALLAVRFDPERLEVLGDPVTVVESAQMSVDAASYSVSQTGTLVYVPGEAEATRSLVWVDRKGRETPLKAPPRGYMIPRISPDGENVALMIRDQENDIWIWDFVNENLRRLTFGPGGGGFPAWTPDSRRLVFRSGRSGRTNLFIQNADGSGAVEQLTASPNEQYSNSVTPDGRYILGCETFPKTGYDVVRFPMMAVSGDRSDSGSSLAESRSQVEPLVQTPFYEYAAVVSADGRYLAYQSNESGQFEIYVRTYPDVGGGRWQVSTAGGTSPAWARSGRELFFLDASGRLTSASVQTLDATFRSGPPARVLDAVYAAPFNLFSYDVSPDAQRFLMIKESQIDDRTSSPSMVIVVNWLEELGRLVPAK